MYANFVKRGLDLAISIVAAVILSPVLLIVAIAILFFDPGPAIFKQARVGRNGVPFIFYKFRTMPVDTGNIPSDKMNDIPLPWISKTIRRTNIDELPQLFNILVGDMSIVGPRPPITSQSDLIALRRAGGALKCRPGLTGLAQVNAFDGMTTIQKARFDCEYANAITLHGDFKIILRTFAYLFKPPPKY